MTKKLLIIPFLFTQLYVADANAGFLRDMFDRLFGKKEKPTKTEIHTKVGAKLTEINQLPVKPDFTDSNLKLECTHGSYTGTPPNATIENKPIFDFNRAYVLEQEEWSTPKAIFSHNNEIHLWNLNHDWSINGKDKLIDFSNEHPKWIFSLVEDVQCLDDKRLLLGINGSDGRSRYHIYIYHLLENRLQHLYKVERKAADRGQLMDSKRMTSDLLGIIHYSGKTRRSAEIYHSRYNHLVLFNSNHPDGIEVLKLGIDDGNILEWFIKDKILYLKTKDSRKDPDNSEWPKYWSLDLTNIL